MAGLVLKGIMKMFGDKGVLDRIDLELMEGELLVLLGPSGCGKSTLLRIVAGLESPDSGEVYLDNRRVDHLRPRDRNVALVFQNYSLYPHMSVRKNLAFPLRVSKLPKRDIERRVKDVAGMLGLEERLEDRPAELSGGQRQRVALGRAIIREPSIFLLDEPLSNLDAELRVRMRQEIVKLQRKLGRAMIHVTHDQGEALTMADRIALLNEGRIEQTGSPEELYRSPANSFVASFIGHPRINLVKCSVQEGRLVPFGTTLPDVLKNMTPEESCLVGLRPEAVEITGDGPYAARVQSCEYAGDSYTAIVQFKGNELSVSNVPRLLEQGDEVRFSFDESRMLYFDSASGLNLMSG
ncbi:MAG: ABC transporter ATP-binding protein [Candidatus Zixiibacteriota bacterium]|nr:MAG: ABC transporter ATP-binding protein [candidate division Zixibacteria bacterium]